MIENLVSVSPNSKGEQGKAQKNPSSLGAGVNFSAHNELARRMKQNKIRSI